MPAPDSRPGAPARKKVAASRRMRRRAEVLFGPDEPRYLGYSRNISKTGMMVGTMRVFAPGTILNLRVTLPSGTFEVRGSVIWAREGPVEWLRMGRVGMGLRFVDPPEELVSRLQEPFRVP